MDICENNSIIVVLQGPKYTSAKDSFFFFFDYVANMWDKVLQNTPRKICERHPLKNLKWCGLF